MRTKITSDTFGYVESAASDLYSIKLKKGRWKGVIFTFGKVDLKEDIQINRDKFEESLSNYFGMKQAKVDTNTKLPDSSDAVEDSFT